MPRGKLKEADETKIRVNYTMLLAELDAKFLVDELYAKQVIDMNDKEEIDEINNRRDRTDKLLKRILDSGPFESFGIFMAILREQYPHVVDVLEGKTPTLQPSTSLIEFEDDGSRPESGASARTESDSSVVSSGLILQNKTNCPKKPTHEYFIPFSQFKEKCPDNIHHPEVYNYLVNLGNQTVRVLTKYISPGRPDGYPLYEMRGGNGKATGSGRIYRVLRTFAEKDGNTCPCLDCLRSSKPKKQWGEFMVITTKKVVYNHEECVQSYCLFGYDSPDMRGSCPELRGVSIITDDISTDVCEIICITHERKVSGQIEELCRKNTELSAKILEKCYAAKPGEPDPNLAVVISHPHGLSKHVTIGFCVEHEPTEVSQTPAVTYTADACSGSHGGPVFILDSRMACCTSHRETTQIGLNFGTGVLWSL